MADLEDTTLIAFVDGELDPVAMREVARAVAADPAAQEKVRRLQLSAPLIRAALDRPGDRDVRPDIERLVQGPVVASVALPARGAGRWIPSRAVALAASLALVLGLAGGFLAARSNPFDTFEDGLAQEVASYHAVYARDTEHPVEIGADRRAHIEGWLGRRLQTALHVPDLADQGWRFEGARLLVVEGRPMAQLLYVRPGDEQHPLGLCVTQGSRNAAELRSQRRGELNLAIWQSKGYAYVLVGWLPTPTLDALARTVSRRMQSS